MTLTFNGSHVGLHLPLQPRAFKLMNTQKWWKHTNIFYISRFTLVKHDGTFNVFKRLSVFLLCLCFMLYFCVFMSKKNFLLSDNKDLNCVVNNFPKRNFMCADVSHLLSPEVDDHLFKLLIFGLVCFSQFLQHLRVMNSFLHITSYLNIINIHVTELKIKMCLFIDVKQHQPFRFCCCL